MQQILNVNIWKKNCQPEKDTTSRNENIKANKPNWGPKSQDLWGKTKGLSHWLKCILGALQPIRQLLKNPNPGGQFYGGMDY